MAYLKLDSTPAAQERRMQAACQIIAERARKGRRPTRNRTLSQAKDLMMARTCRSSVGTPFGEVNKMPAPVLGAGYFCTRCKSCPIRERVFPCRAAGSHPVDQPASFFAKLSPRNTFPQFCILSKQTISIGENNLKKGEIYMAERKWRLGEDNDY